MNEIPLLNIIWYFSSISWKNSNF